MKKHIYIFSIVLVLSIFSSITAKADDSLLGGILGALGLGDNNSTPTAPANQPAALPIDSNIVFLTVAGVAVGIFTIKKSKRSSIALKG